MKICPNCNMQLDDNAAFCTNCGAQLESPVQPQAQQFNYAAPTYQQPFNPYYNDIKNAISTVRTLGIISIVFLFFAYIVTIICSIIGIIKGNEAIRKAQSIGDPNLVQEAQSAKKLNKIALIIAIVVTAIAILIGIAFIIFGFSTAAGSGALPDVSEFGF